MAHAKMSTSSLRVAIVLLTSFLFGSAEPTTPTTNIEQSSVEVEMDRLRHDLEELRKMVYSSGIDYSRGYRRSYESANSQAQELSELRARLHTVDHVALVRSELKKDLTSLKSQLDAAQETIRTMQNDLNTIQSEMGVFKVQLQHGMAAAQLDCETKVVNARSELQTTFTFLQMELQGNATHLMTQVTDIRDQLENRVMDAISEFKTNASHALSDIQVRAKRVLDDQKITATSFQQQLQEDLRDEVVRNLTDERLNLQAKMDISLESMQSNLWKIVTRVEGGLGVVVTELRSSIKEVRGELLRNVSHALRITRNLFSQVDRRVADVKSDLDNDIRNFQGDVVSNLTSFNATLTMEVAKVQTTVDTARAELQEEVKGIEIRTADTLVQFRAMSDRNMTSMKVQVESDIIGLKSEIRTNLTNFWNEMEHRLCEMNTSMQAFRSDVGDELYDVRQESRNNVSSMYSKFHMLDSKVTADSEDHEEDVSALMVNFTATHDILYSKLESIKQAGYDARGSTFVRWGNSTCPQTADLVYTGVVGGSWYDHVGSVANRLCLTLGPEIHSHPGSVGNYLYGGEYYDGNDAVCSVCRTRLSTTIMIPGTQSCPSGWTQQYKGHLVAGYYGHQAVSEYLCLDYPQENRQGGMESKSGAFLYLVHIICGSLPCPPYTSSALATCVVCSK